MPVKPTFPTTLHQQAAAAAQEYFFKIANVDSILVVNSCARGQAAPESDLDMAILVKPGTTGNDKDLNEFLLRFHPVRAVF